MSRLGMTTSQKIEEEGLKFGTFEQYLLAMNKWMNRAIHPSVQNGHAVLNADDLKQESRIALAYVWNKYSKKVPPIELVKLGVSAVHLRGVRALRDVGRKRRRLTDGSLAIVSSLTEADGINDDGEDSYATQCDPALRDDRTPERSAMLRETINRAAEKMTRAERAALRHLMNPEEFTASALSPESAAEVFKSVKKKIAAVLREEGITA